MGNSGCDSLAQGSWANAVLRFVSYPEPSFGELRPGDRIAEHVRLVAHLETDHEGSIWDALHAIRGPVTVKVFAYDDPDVGDEPVLEHGVSPFNGPFVVCARDAGERLVREPPPPRVVDFEHLHALETCRPPLRRNWAPALAAAAIAVVGALVGAGAL